MQLRGELRLFSPGVIVPAKRLRKPFWEVVRCSLLDICERNILTSEVTGPNKLRIVLTGNFLAEEVRKLANCLSEFPGKTAEAVVRKTKCFPLK